MMTLAQNEPPVSAASHAAALAQSVAATLRVARALVEAQREVDLAGLEQETGRLCAAALDLPHTDGKSLRLHLIVVLAELDALGACIAARRDDRP